MNKEQIIYIAGPVSSKGDIQAKNDFWKTEQELRKRYKNVVNIFAHVAVIPGKSWKEYVVETLKILLYCNAIYMQKGWKESKGATIEYHVAKTLGYTIEFEK